MLRLPITLLGVQGAVCASIKPHHSLLGDETAVHKEHNVSAKWYQFNDLTPLSHSGVLQHLTPTQLWEQVSNGPNAAQMYLGQNIFIDVVAAQTLMGNVYDFEDTQDDFFPEANGANNGEYVQNDDLKQYGTLMLAYASNVYTFKNGAHEHTCDAATTPGCIEGHATTEAIERDQIPRFFPAIGKCQQGDCWCKTDPSTGNSQPVFENDPAFSYKVQTATTTVRTPVTDTQASIYEWRRSSEQDVILTVAFRGSESPTLQPLFDVIDAAENGNGSYYTPEAIRAAQAIATSMPEVIADWVGTDMNVAPQEDLICREPNVLLHNAVQRAYMSVRGNILEGLRTKLTTLLAAGYTPSTIKIFVTGHSLGAALATMATYDLWCNKETNLGITHDGNQHTQFELFGTITFGHFFTLYGEESVNKFMETVPKTRRMRVNACSSQDQGMVPWAGEDSAPQNDCTSCAHLWGYQPEWWAIPYHWYVLAGCGVSKMICEAQRTDARFNPVGHVVTCDAVGSNFKNAGANAVWDVDYKNSFSLGYYHPTDGDFQAAWVNQEPIPEIHTPIFSWGGDCFASPNNVLCHLLERYSQGMRMHNKYNGNICTAYQSPPGQDDRMTYLNQSKVADGGQEGFSFGTWSPLSPPPSPPSPPPPPFRPPPSPPPVVTGGLVAVEGPCPIVLRDSTTTCVQSYGFAAGQAYNNGESCIITPSSLLSISTTSFNTEHNYDFLNIPRASGQYTRFSGDVPGPAQMLQSTQPILWQSDGSVTRPGWEVCFHGVPTFWEVVSGPCKISATNARCIESSSFGYSTGHGHNERCELKILRNANIYHSQFHTEACCDKMTIHGREYKGTDGPDAVFMRAGDSVLWSSDYSVAQPGGWQVCVPEH